MKKIGLFFGSFNPIHIGHLIIANKSLEIRNFDEVWFVVSPQNPHKDLDSLLPVEKRIEMIEMSLPDKKKFKICDIELTLPIPSYTIVTLNKLKEKYQHNFSIIMGMDTLKSIETWKDYKSVVEYNKIIVYDRIGHEIDKVKYINKYSNVDFIELPSFELSSTYIRKQIEQNKFIKFMVPDNVIEYIKKNNFYKLKSEI